MTTNSPYQIPEEWLSAYLDGELNQEQCQAVEAAVAQNPQLAQQLDELQATRQLASQLPGYPNAVPSRWAGSARKSWTAELDDGLDSEINQGSAADLPSSISNGSLATSTEQQLKRTLADDSHDPSSSQFRKQSSPWKLYRWLALAASLVGCAFMASALWPPADGVQLSGSPESPSVGMRSPGSPSPSPLGTSSEAASGMAAEAVSGDPLVDNSMARADSAAAELIAPMAASNLEGGALSAMGGQPLADGALSMAAPADNFGLPMEGPGTMVAPTASPSDPALAFNLQDAPADMGLKGAGPAGIGPAGIGPADNGPAGFGPAGFGPAIASQSSESAMLPGTSLPAEMSSPMLKAESLGGEAELSIAGGNVGETRAFRSSEPAPSQINPESVERALPLAGPEQLRNRAQAAPPAPSAKRSAVDRSSNDTLATAASWHRTSAWTDEAVAEQLESNAMLLPLRPMLRGSYSNVQRAQLPDPLIPIAILRLESSRLQEIVDRLQPIANPPLIKSNQATTRVIFLSKVELDQVLGGLIAADETEAKTMKSPQVFWVAPAQPVSDTQQRILILNEQ